MMARLTVTPVVVSKPRFVVPACADWLHLFGLPACAFSRVVTTVFSLQNPTSRPSHRTGMNGDVTRQVITTFMLKQKERELDDLRKEKDLRDTLDELQL